MTNTHPERKPIRVKLCHQTADTAAEYIKGAKRAGYTVHHDEKFGFYFVYVLQYDSVVRSEK